MAKTNIKNLGAVLDKLKSAISELDISVYKDLGEYVKTRIVAKARTGKTMITGAEEPLKPLSPAYIKSRQALIDNRKKAIKAEWKSRKQSLKGKSGLINVRAQAESGVDPAFFSPKRSNLTVTGQYLSSLSITNIDQKSRTLIIEPTGSRDGGLDNKKLGEYLGKGGRNIFGIDALGRKVLKTKVLAAIRQQLRKNLLRK